MQPDWAQRRLGDNRHQLSAGFSMIELLVTIAITSILLGIAVPSFQSLLTSSQISATTNSLVFSLQAARSEAVKRSVPTGVCTSSNSLDNYPTCTPGVGYEEGWIAYVDDNLNGVRDGAELIVMAVEAPGDAFTITADNQFNEQIYFDDDGGSSNIAGVPLAGTINIAFGGGTESRTVRISANGRINTVVP